MQFITKVVFCLLYWNNSFHYWQPQFSQSLLLELPILCCNFRYFSHVQKLHEKFQLDVGTFYIQQFRYYEKGKKIEKISYLFLRLLRNVKKSVRFFQICLAFSEYLNFRKLAFIIENATEHEKGLLILIAIAPNFDCKFFRQNYLNVHRVYGKVKIL